MTRVLDSGTTVGVLGAGAMGSGIAQVAAARGHRVILADARAEAVTSALGTIGASLDRLVEKGRLTREAADASRARIEGNAIVAGDPVPFAPCGLVIEAIVERLEAKRDAFRAMEAVMEADAVLATNTSSLSIASIAAGCTRAERVLGVHFFNPAPVMPLVEIVPGVATDPAVTATVRALVDGWGKRTVLASDTPGFIVNRVARPFYGESLRLLDEGIAGIATIDWAMKELGGFRMGPFELMDFIGHDVNFVVTRSVFEAMYWDPRYRPSLTQQRLLEAGWLGRKSGRGFYDYRPGTTAPEPTRDPELGRRIVDRVLAMLVNEAVDAVHMRVASVADLELAMTSGVNYPRGLLAWGEEIGLATVLARLHDLHEEYGEDRYRPSPLLRRMVQRGERFLS
jgi:3-hydroxybutyryl-CoA dehydrogenase